MYISDITITNFRCFNNTKISFNEGINVIIGENNSGKTTLFKAFELIFNRKTTKRLDINDFNKSITDFSVPPEIEIKLVLKETENEETIDKSLVASWLTKIEYPWVACLTYKFLLPEEEQTKYKDEIKKEMKINKKWEIVNKYIDKYISRIYAGNPELKNKIEPDLLDKFDCQILDALRDAESNMLTGKNALLKNVLNYFLDKKELEKLKTEDEKNKLKERNKQTFKEQSLPIIDNIKKRLDLSRIQALSQSTGAVTSDKLSFEGELNESNIIDVLKLIIEKKSFNIPLINNGLGYNNLIYISLILSQLEMNTDIKQKGQNASIFPLLMIEEPEAHLHPALQYNFMQFLENEEKSNNISRQIFVSSHSTDITSATGLDSIICLQEISNNIKAINVGKSFGSSKEDVNSKKYIERFLDATKSNLLFSKAIIFVEGLSEQLLLPILVKYSLNKDTLEKIGFIDDYDSIEKRHVCVINAGGSTFKHFLKLFNNKSSIKNENEIIKTNLLQKKVACIVDTDPAKKKKGKSKSRFKKCWPIEIGINQDEFDYRKFSPIIKNLDDYTNSQVSIFYKEKQGKTFEYDLAFSNYNQDYFINDLSGLKEDIEMILNAKTFNDNLKKMLDDSCLEEVLEKQNTEFKSLIPHIIASLYLLYVEDTKAEKALDLSKELKSNFQYKLNKDKHSSFKKFMVPNYINKAINWVCDNNEKNND